MTVSLNTVRLVLETLIHTLLAFHFFLEKVCFGEIHYIKIGIISVAEDVSFEQIMKCFSVAVMGSMSVRQSL